MGRGYYSYEIILKGWNLGHPTEPDSVEVITIVSTSCSAALRLAIPHGRELFGTQGFKGLYIHGIHPAEWD